MRLKYVRGGAVQELFLLRGGPAWGFKQPVPVRGAADRSRRGGVWAAAARSCLRHAARIGPSVGASDGCDCAGQVADVRFGAESLGCISVARYGGRGDGERSSVAPWLLLPVHGPRTPAPGRDKRGLVGWIQEGGMRAAGGRAEGTAEVDWRWAGGVRGERARGREGSQSSWAPSWDKLVSEGYANASKQNGHEMICFIVSDWLFKKLIF
jgi:hypothetical protein